MIQSIGIIGLGLIGGSLAKAFRTKCNISDIVAFGRNEEALAQARQDGAITRYTTKIDDSFSVCDLVFVCTPVHKTFEIIQQLKPFLKPGALVTDVGSVKQEIFKQMEPYKDICFIGGHPMAGSEQTGYLAAKSYLFENAFYILTPLPHVGEQEVEALKNLLLTTGAIPIVIDPARHDYSVAAISHVPHILAAALVNAVKEIDGPEQTMHMLAAGGFRDITRIASGSPDMWFSICLENRREILQVLNRFKDSIDLFTNYLENADEKTIRRFFEQAKAYRDTFQAGTTGGYGKTYQIYVDILDRPGSIATVATMLSVNDINIKNIGIVNNREHENGVLHIVFDQEKYMLKSIELLEKMNFLVYPQ